LEWHLDGCALVAAKILEFEPFIGAGAAIEFRHQKMLKLTSLLQQCYIEHVPVRKL
jgi:hypothetical protein